MNTYRAFAVTAPGKLELVERPVIAPGKDEVRIRVEACGVCHSDSATVESSFPNLALPRVPGHEVVGRIDAIGSDNSQWKVGQRVGVGFLGGEDGDCSRCRRGDYVNCARPTITGITQDGGYAEVMMAKAHGIASVPDSMGPVEAAPLLCAGLTTFNALRNADLRAGSLIAVHGLGGLGHLGVQYARRMGFHTVAVGRGDDKNHLAERLGAHRYINSDKEDAAQVLEAMGGANAILGTAPDGAAMGRLIAGLAPQGKLIVVAVPSAPIPTSAQALVFGGRVVQASLTGRTIEEEDTLRFSAMQQVRPMVQAIPFEHAPDAYARMMRGEARFRFVLTMPALAK